MGLKHVVHYEGDMEIISHIALKLNTFVKCLKVTLYNLFHNSKIILTELYARLDLESLVQTTKVTII